MPKPLILISLLMFAVPAAPAMAESVDDEAMTQFKLGVDLYRDKQFEQAAIAFERAYDLKPSYKLLYNIAQVENDLRHYAEALKGYRKYLADGGDNVPDDRRTEVEGEIERLQTLVGRVVIETEHEGLTVFIDDRRHGDTPLDGPVYVDMGEHKVLLKNGTEEVHSEVVKVAGDQTVTVEIGDADEEEAAPVEAPVPVEDDMPKRIWTWVALGVGVAAGAGAGVTGGLSKAKVDDIKAQCDGNSCPADQKEDADSAKLLGNLSTGLTIGAGVLVAAAVTLFFVEPGLGEEEEPAVAIVPTTSPDGAGISITGRF